MVNVGDPKTHSGAVEVAVSNNGLPAYVVSSTPDNGFEVLGRELPQSSAAASDRVRIRLLRDQRQEFLENAAVWVGKLSAAVRVLEKESRVGQATKSVAEVRDLIQGVVTTANDESDEEDDDDERFVTRRTDLLRLDVSVAYDVLDELETGHME